MGFWRCQATADHPRIRGEHDREFHHKAGLARIIPAYAGSTRSGLGAYRRPSDHPRIRGEHWLGWPSLFRRRGSSPHTRGARGRPGRLLRRRRIIPAYAGSTMISTCGAGTPADHPRIRGEHCQAILHVSSLAGSSPHTRGAHVHVRLRNHVARIIPAYAGSTSSSLRALTTIADHPRIRGEHVMPSRNVNGVTGSSPHTRGAQFNFARDAKLVRIIPAYAGSTYGLLLSQPAADGSSPHTRGAHLNFRFPAIARRIIPAYAGSTHVGHGSGRSLQDHPRIRGEHSPRWPARRIRLRIIPAYAGSTPYSLPAERSRHWIIPAYAGSTSRQLTETSSP